MGQRLKNNLGYSTPMSSFSELPSQELPSQELPSPSPSPILRFNPQYYQRFAAIYPAIVFFGYLISIFLNPSPSYFSSKRNFLNIYFVKYGWAWTTLLYLPYAWLFSHNQIQRFYRPLSRWAIATAYWFALTQWFFGPSIIDRVFTLTGGGCNFTDTSAAVGAAGQLITSITCKLGGGAWQGGHDISGHCMLLIHSSLFLIEETWYGAAGRARNGWPERALGWALGGLLLIWAWMLLMTAVYFHGHMELASGTVFGMAFWAFMYTCVYPSVTLLGMPEKLL